MRTARAPLQCRYPGCTRPARTGEGRGAPPRYCDLPEHHRRSADRERARLLAGRTPPPLETQTDPEALLAYIAELRRDLAAAHAALAAAHALLVSIGLPVPGPRPTEHDPTARRRRPSHDAGLVGGEVTPGE